MGYLSSRSENRLIQLVIIIFWWFYWLLNVVDKIIGGSTFLWVGKDRMAQFVKYFSSIGIESRVVPTGFLIFSSVIETIALLFVTGALVSFMLSKFEKVHKYFFKAMLTSLILFIFFSIGDQIFGDRVELLEHSIYFLVVIVSWFVFMRLDNEAVSE